MNSSGMAKNSYQTDIVNLPTGGSFTFHTFWMRTYLSEFTKPCNTCRTKFNVKSPFLQDFKRKVQI